MTNSNKTLVFLPGWGFKASIWDEMASTFNSNQTLLLDLPREIELENIIENLQQKIPDNSTLIAWSLGGMLAVQLCLQYPGKIDKLILVSSTLKMSTSKPDINSLWLKFVALVQHPNRDMKTRINLKKHMVNQDIYLTNYFDLLFKMDIRDAFQSLQTPVYHLHGDQDVIIPNNSPYTTLIPGAGHAPFITHKEIFAAELQGILNAPR